ncbi:MAG: hypothetical protein DRR16_32815, partial [Candidatus Parabeggiatoa sp. nov. 3]
TPKSGRTRRNRGEHAEIGANTPKSGRTRRNRGEHTGSPLLSKFLTSNLLISHPFSIANISCLPSANPASPSAIPASLS